MPKINSIMDAVTALTTLGDEESGSDEEKKPSAENPVEETEEAKEEPVVEEQQAFDEVVKEEPVKPRYIPEHKKPDAALTFPEKLMNMMKYADQFKDDETYSVAWVPDGKSFIVRVPEVFTKQVLPMFFKATKFQSFTRKLYRWGFRQVNRGIGPDDPIIFGNEFFQRDDEELMVKMRSMTAAASRRNARGGNLSHAGRKRSLEELDEQRKMILLDRYMQEKVAMGGADPRYMAQFMRPFPGGFPQGMPPGMMMQGRFPPGMMMPGVQLPSPGDNMYHSQEGRQQQPPEEGGEGGEHAEGEGGEKQGIPPQQLQQGGGSEQEIVNAAISALRYAA